jgi:hypothetical protein
MSTEDKDTGIANDTSGADRGDRVDRGADRGSERDGHHERAERGKSIRDELKASYDELSRDNTPEPAGRAARRAKEATADEPGSAGAAAAPDTGIGHSGDATPLAAGGPPARWEKEAKAEWEKVPKKVQDAVTKGEADVQKGVDSIKAKYNDIDQALSPHLQTIRNAGHSPGTSIRQLFAWHEALNKNPVESFDALAKAHGYDIMALAQAARGGAQGAQQQQQTNGQQGYDPRQIINYVDQRLGELTAQQTEKTIQGILADFAKSHPHYERLRGKMAALVAGGAVPLTPEGAVDLEKSYQAAMRMDDELGELMFAERIAAEKKKQREYADRARRAGASLGGAAPGSNNSLGGTKKRPGSRSVRDSIAESIEELRE